jgi:hypothetical protein
MTTPNAGGIKYKAITKRYGKNPRMIAAGMIPPGYFQHWSASYTKYRH